MIAHCAVATERLRALNYHLGLDRNDPLNVGSIASLDALVAQCRETIALVAEIMGESKVGAGSRLALPQLPTEILLEVLSSCEARSIALLDSSCRSVVEQACVQRLRALAPLGYHAVRCHESWATALCVAERQQQHCRTPVSLGDDHTLCILAGQAHACGSNDSGRLGWDHEGQAGGVGVPGLRPISALAQVHVVAVSAGAAHSLALDGSGCIYSWGHGLHGKLGHGDTRDRAVPTVIAAGPGPFASIAAASHHSLACTEAGRVYSWGHGAKGRLGTGSGTSGMADQVRPVEVQGSLQGARVVAVSARSEHCLALTTEGAVYAWGNNADGQLGLPKFIHGSHLSGGDGGCPGRSSPTRIPHLSERRVVAIAAGSLHSAVLTVRGVLFTFGAQGAWLGRGGDLSPSQGGEGPAVVDALWGLPCEAVSTGDGCMAVVLRSGLLYTWGLGEKGALGHGNADDVEAPECVEALRACHVRYVGVGAVHMAGLTRDEELLTWGCAEHGKLGHGMEHIMETGEGVRHYHTGGVELDEQWTPFQVTAQQWRRP